MTMAMIRQVAFFVALLAGQLSGAQGLDTVSIPGTEIRFELAYISAGELLLESSSGLAVPLELGAFWMGVRELTYEEYALFQQLPSVAGGSNPAVDAVSGPSRPYLDFTYGMGTAGGFPAVSMTQQAALRYCRWLYQQTGQFFRLPTEAEWAYACSAGQDWQPENLRDYAWYDANSAGKYQKTGMKKPNPWGLYDMLGNVAEWTLDDYQEDYLAAIGQARANPWLKPEKRHSRTVKGGSFDSRGEECRCAARLKSQARWQARDPQIPKSIWWNTDSPFVGFRLLRPAQQPTAAEVEAFFSAAIRD
jgi:formylglycine-generating enzyme required for sulfatase activity